LLTFIIAPAQSRQYAISPKLWAGAGAKLLKWPADMGKTASLFSDPVAASGFIPLFLFARTAWI
jgi:hypothetical protein